MAAMFIGYFTERPYQDPALLGRPFVDLGVSNVVYDPEIGANLYHRYLDEKLYAEEMGFDGVALNEHHSTAFCMGNVMNVEAGILARISTRVKIILIGNVLPIHDDPLTLAEELALIDVVSRGRLVTGWVRGNGRESVTHNAVPPYNWERYQEAHDFIKKAWSTPGPFRWEGKHFQYRYVNPWPRPFQQPHPPMWIPGALSRNTVKWAAEHRYPYVMLATELEPTRRSFEYYREVARESGYESGTQHIAYMFKVHVDETEELAEQAGRRYLEGPSNIFIEGNEGVVDDDSDGYDSTQMSPWKRPAFPVVLRNLPGMTQTNNLLPTGETYRGRDGGKNQFQQAGTGGAQAQAALGSGSFERQVEKLSIITGTPKTVLPKIRRVLETLRPGGIILWDGDGGMTHDDAMRSLRLMGTEVLPAIREMGRELDLKGAFEVDPATNQPLVETAEPVGTSTARP
jgi:alkanesulfonate monooxygenase SsuD/methylene tetrahydromethanopterin reductase-like flavin-dependent oxidoreductase (luciferase family)